MSLTLRSAKGSILTNDEVDANFSGLADGSLWNATALAAKTFTSLVLSGALTLGGNLTVSSASADTAIFLNNTSAGGRSYTIGSGGTGSALPADFYIYDASGAAFRFVITGAGRVLVGTTTDDANNRLQVNGGVSTTGINISSGGAVNTANSATIDTNGAGQTRFYSRGANAATKGTFAWHAQSSDGSIDFTGMSLNGSGTLTVYEDIVLSRAAPGAALSWASGGAGAIARLIVASGNNFSFSSDGGGTYPVIIGGATYKLSVTGDIGFFGNLSTYNGFIQQATNEFRIFGNTGDTLTLGANNAAGMLTVQTNGTISIANKLLVGTATDSGNGSLQVVGQVANVLGNTTTGGYFVDKTVGTGFTGTFTSASGDAYTVRGYDLLVLDGLGDGTAASGTAGNFSSIYFKGSNVLGGVAVYTARISFVNPANGICDIAFSLRNLGDQVEAFRIFGAGGARVTGPVGTGFLQFRDTTSGASQGAIGATNGGILEISGNNYIKFHTSGGSASTLATMRGSIDLNGNFVFGPGTGALATTATDGFVYIPSCAGTPTGTPTAYSGMLPIVYDSTGNNFYVYNGAWKKVALA